MDIQSYDELLSKLQEAMKFCHAVGLNRAPITSRFAVYEDRVRRLHELSTRFQSGQLSVQEQTNLRTELSENVFTLVEVLEFVNVIPYLRSQPENIVRWKLRNVLMGPSRPLMEDQNSNVARNTLFELNLASKLSRAGLDTSLEASSDICCIVKDRRVLIECKRPFSNKSIVKNVRVADKKLHHSLASAPAGSRGVIAVSFSRIVNPKDFILQYSDEDSAKHYLEDLIDEQVLKVPHKSPLGKKIIGLLFHVIVPSVDLANSRIVSGEQINAETAKKEDSIDYATFFALGKGYSTLVLKTLNVLFTRIGSRSNGILRQCWHWK